MCSLGRYEKGVVAEARERPAERGCDLGLIAECARRRTVLVWEAIV